MRFQLAPFRIVTGTALILVASAGTGFATGQPESPPTEEAGSAAEPHLSGEAEEPAAAGFPPRGQIDRWGLFVAGFLVSFDTKLRWETPSPIDPEVDLEDNLGLEEELTRGRLEASLRVGKRSILSLEYIRLRRAAVQTVLEESIIWEDEVFQAGATVESDFDSDIYKFAWTWSALRSPRFDLGLLAGISAIDFRASLRGILTANGTPGTSEFQNEEVESQVFPVPVIGIRFLVNLRHNLLLRGLAQYFRYTDDKLGAELIDALIAVEYIPFTHVGFGVGYDLFETKYRQDKDNLQIRYLIEGPIAYVRVLY